MISESMQKALMDQVNAELYSSYLYLSMSSDLDSKGLAGFALWMKSQAQEELYHGMKLYDFVIERGGRALLKPIDGPQTEWSSPLAIFEAAYAHEQKVTGMINNLMNMAIEEKDHATSQFLQWFIKEQVEEEASADEVVQKLKLIGDGGNGLFMLDKEMGARPLLFAFPVSSG